DGLNEARILCRVAERVAQLAHSSIQSIVKLNKGGRGPQQLLDLFPRDKLSRSLQQQSQNPKRLPLQPDADAPLGQDALAHIERKSAKTIDIAIRMFARHPPQLRSKSGQFYHGMIRDQVNCNVPRRLAG